MRTFRVLEERLRTSQASFQIQPRVFDEQFPHLVLYVQDVSAAATHWHGVFLAESDAGDISRLTLAEDAIVIADPRERQVGVAPARRRRARILAGRTPTNTRSRPSASATCRWALSNVGRQQTLETTNAERSIGRSARRARPAERAAPWWNSTAGWLFLSPAWCSRWWRCPWARGPAAAAAPGDF